MSLQPIQSGQSVIDTRQTTDLLCTSNSRSDEGLASASSAIANFGKLASVIPGFGPAISGVCGVLSGILSFLASPCG
jgi:hypothetical protein